MIAGESRKVLDAAEFDAVVQLLIVMSRHAEGLGFVLCLDSIDKSGYPWLRPLCYTNIYVTTT